MLTRTPKDIYDKLSRTVFGQESAKKALSILTNYTDPSLGEGVKLNPRIMLVGQTGSGKTFLVNELKNALTWDITTPITGTLPTRLFVNIDCGMLLPSGANTSGITILNIEKQISESLSAQIASFPEFESIEIQLCNNFVIVFDEFDKLCRASDGSSDEFYGKAQSDFLNFVEGKQLTLNIKGNANFLHVISINTKSIPMVFMGAYSKADLYSSYIPKEYHVGFFPTESSLPVNEVSLKDKLVDMGLMREMAGRISRIILMDAPDQKFYRDVLDKQLIPEINKELTLFQKQLILNDTYKEELIRLALGKKEGARALKELLYAALEDYLFDMVTIDLSKFDVVDLVTNQGASHEYTL